MTQDGILVVNVEASQKSVVLTRIRGMLPLYLFIQSGAFIILTGIAFLVGIIHMVQTEWRKIRLRLSAQGD